MLIGSKPILRQCGLRGLLHRFASPQGPSRRSSNYEARDNDDPHRRIIGNREIVCHGMNGNPTYIDSWDYPFPAIRYRECTPELMALREKERGDWRKLTIGEKKCLYRASFRQTFSELQAPNSDWKCIIGVVLMGISLSFWLHLFIHHKVQVKWPESFSTENRIAQYYRQVDLNMQPFSGVYRPPGAELRIHAKNKSMLKKAHEDETN
ncbi:hypothetical protein TSAR_003374 [Trichomalopsis sarcophagae]|uniref:Cytochrome c oxidase subunit 4 n=1 Tax=Trichomalopsis sarcophagae TaxID=543379 RepID=A0A232EP47_9HYME|nr:hypothetical protein TSAR_003374 [Trichomalopsis sarcophagae]